VLSVHIIAAAARVSIDWAQQLINHLAQVLTSAQPTALNPSKRCHHLCTSSIIIIIIIIIKI